MRKFIHDHHISFQHAFAGVRWAFTTQPNFQIHTILSLIALWISWYVGLSESDFAIIIFTIVLGFSAEMINTAIESVTDLITTEWRQEAKIAKDVSAGMMLLVAFGSVVVAMVILLPRLLEVFSV